MDPISISQFILAFSRLIRHKQELRKQPCNTTLVSRAGKSHDLGKRIRSPAVVKSKAVASCAQINSLGNQDISPNPSSDLKETLSNVSPCKLATPLDDIQETSSTSSAEEHFEPSFDTECQQILRQRLKMLRQDHSVNEYIEQFQDLTHRLQLTEDAALERFIDGLKHHCRFQVRMKSPSTLSEACSLALSYEIEHHGVHKPSQMETGSTISYHPSESHEKNTGAITIRS
ncbi:uncharacterized protein VTP21DRAFT_5494 [Calcarisporiella thermophila]|uniref:uncharacterized protein n=1 Tax=Calcarisporiella thermophila TaxID=911321 RepID=UPI0037434B1E